MSITAMEDSHIDYGSGGVHDGDSYRCNGRAYSRQVALVLRCMQLER